MINLNKILYNSTIEGPGNRFVIWVQGCNIGCKNCSNVDALSLTEKFFIPVESLVKEIIKAKEKYNIEGVTILGGEPFLQPYALEKLCNEIKKNKLSIICFTGYIYEKIETEYKNILKNIDILIDGPFIFSKLDHKRRLIGSTNQRVLKLSDHFKDCDYFDKPHSQVEIQLYRDRVEFNGNGTSLVNDEGEIIFKIK